MKKRNTVEARLKSQIIKRESKNTVEARLKSQRVKRESKLARQETRFQEIKKLNTNDGQQWTCCACSVEICKFLQTSNITNLKRKGKEKGKKFWRKDFYWQKFCYHFFFVLLFREFYFWLIFWCQDNGTL